MHKIENAHTIYASEIRSNARSAMNRCRSLSTSPVCIQCYVLCMLFLCNALCEAHPGTRVRASVLTGLGHVRTRCRYSAIYVPWRYGEKFVAKLLDAREAAAKWPFSIPHFTSNSVNLVLSQFALYDEFFQHQSGVWDIWFIPVESGSRWNFTLCKQDIIIKLL